jgi:uncharacterized protein YidB (DUF937 family)
MGILDSVVGALTGQTGSAGQAHPVVGILSELLEQNGGLQGLMSRFSQHGHGGVFDSWVGTGQNQHISSDQIQQVLGSQQVTAIAQKLGIDPAQASRFLAQHLPGIIDKLTPSGSVDPLANHQSSLLGLLPLLLQGLGALGGKPSDA